MEQSETYQENEENQDPIEPEPIINSRNEKSPDIQVHIDEHLIPLINNRISHKKKGNSKKYKFCVFQGNYPQYIRDALSLRGNWVEVQPAVECVMTADLIWKPFNFSKSVSYKVKLIFQGFDLYDKRSQETKRPLIYNHYENISVISSKTGLLKTLRDYYGLNKQAIEANYQVYDTIPMAYIITSNPGDIEFHQFKKKFQNIEKGYSYNEKFPPKQFQENIWLMKPANMNQGKGIEIFTTLKQIYSFLANKPCDQQWVIQKYMEKPLLFHGRKFDIRVLALGTNDYELYFYNTGYLRTSSDEYSLDNKNKFVHLTNNCYQKHSQNYEKYEQGNQLTFKQLQEYLDQTFPQYQVKIDDIIMRIKDLVIDCFVSSLNLLNPNKREHCFEVMGFDFMIDEDLRVWLIEVNTNPYFGVLNKNLPNFIDNLVDDTFRLTVDKVFSRDTDDSDRPNDYELLFSQAQGINKRRSFNEGLYPVTEIKQKLDQEKDQVMQKFNKNENLTNKQTNHHQQNHRKLQKQSYNTGFYMTIEGSSRSKSALSFKQQPTKNNNDIDKLKTSNKFKNNSHTNETKGTTLVEKVLRQQSQLEANDKDVFSPKFSREKYQKQDIQSDYVESKDTHAQNSPRSNAVLKSVQNNMGQTSISILLKKKAEENTKTTMQNQQEYLNKIQRMLRVKSLIEQVKDSLQNNQNESFDQKRKEFNKLFSQIIQIFTSPDSYNKKDLLMAVQAFRMLIFSHFIIHFNEKQVLQKLMDLLKLQGNQYQEIKETVLKNINELSKHYTIRSIFLSKKLFSKFTKVLISNISSFDQEKKDKSIVLMLIQQLISIASVPSSKHYIPGETKEIEQIRKKAIVNGVLVLTEYICEITKNKEIVSKLKTEILDNLDLNDNKLHIYSIFQHFKQKLEDGQSESKKLRESIKSIEPSQKERMIDILSEIQNDKAFSQIKYYIDSQFKTFTTSFPSLLDRQADFFNIDYLKNQFDKFKSAIETAPKDGITSSKTNILLEQNKKQNLPKQTSSKNILGSQTVQESIAGSQEITLIHNSQKKSQSNKAKERKKKDKYIKQAFERPLARITDQKSANKTFQVEKVYDRSHNQVEDENYTSKDAKNNKSFERIREVIQENDLLQRPSRHQINKVKTIRNNISSNHTLLPTLNDHQETSQNQTENHFQNQGNENSLVLPNLEQVNKKTHHYNYGMSASIYAAANVYQQAIINTSQYIKLRPYLQANSITSKQLKKYINNQQSSVSSNASLILMGGASQRKDGQYNLMPLTNDISKSHYYQSGFMNKLKKGSMPSLNDQTSMNQMYYKSTYSSGVIQEAQSEKKETSKILEVNENPISVLKSISVTELQSAAETSKSHRFQSPHKNEIKIPII